MKKNIVVLSILLLIVAFANGQSFIGKGKAVDPNNYKQTKSASYTKAAVSTAHPLASMVGAQIIKQGGNAFDAAIAVQLTLAVVYPGAGNLGGGGFILAHTKDNKNIALDFRETAPAKAFRDMYLDTNGNVNSELSLNGHLSVGVPGTVAGLFETLPYAKLSFTKLIEPAITLAKNGFVITQHEADNLNSNQNDFIKYNSTLPVFVKQQKWKAGDTLIQKDLAHTLELIKQKGTAGFYEGETAQHIVDEMQKGKGIITLDDLKNYKAKIRTPLSFNYRGYDVVGFPPPSSGGIILLQVLKMIEKHPVSSYGFQSTKSVQLIVEAERRSYADRAQHMADPDHWKVRVAKLTSDAYIQQRMQDYSPNKATKSMDVHAGNIKESDETTHISIYDAEGNMVSITTTLNNSYGSKTVVSGAGFLLNDEMDDFSSKPGTPNMYGAIGGEANAIQPNKRMLSSLCPALVLKDGKPYLVVGTPGGTTIPTSVIQTLVNVIDFNMSVADAVNKPKFHHQWLPDEVYVEKSFNADTRKGLQAMGYTITEKSQIGRVEAIKINKNNIEAAADIRGDDCVAGF